MKKKLLSVAVIAFLTFLCMIQSGPIDSVTGETHKIEGLKNSTPESKMMDTFIDEAENKTAAFQESIQTAFPMATTEEALAYLQQQIPELDAMDSFITEKSEGEAHLCIRPPDNLTMVYNPCSPETLRGYYYCFYVGEDHADHTVNWEWFLVKNDLSEILCDVISEADRYSLQEWRNSERYLDRMTEMSDMDFTETGFIRVQDKYLITDGSQMETLSQMIAGHTEIEPGIPADTATYFLCNDIEVKDWLRIGSLKSPFKGIFMGNGHVITGIDFYIVTCNPERQWGKDTIIQNRIYLEKSEKEVSKEEIEAVFGDEGKDILDELFCGNDILFERVQLQKVEGLDCCIFSLEGTKEYHVLLKGSWQEKEVPFRHMIFTKCCLMPYYFMTVADINFDGSDDLVIQEGWSGGSGGSWTNCHGIIWNVKTSDFEDFPSFPSYISFMELNEERIIERWRLGWGEEGITVYGIVDGEYTTVQELLLKDSLDGECTLSYYEMGELIATHIITDRSTASELYPELDYWMKG